MELHGGRIEARSAGLGHGSEFVISLSKSLIVDAPPQDAGLTGNGADVVAARRILVADDNRDGAETMSMLLKLSGHDVHVAHSGMEAFEVARRIRPDIAVLDIGMPDVSELRGGAADPA